MSADVPIAPIPPFARADRPALLVSLPTNDVALAEAAVAAGADALKAHLHVTHRVSGVSFGDLATECAALEPILALDMPVGLVVGPDATREEFIAARADGVVFFDTFLAHAAADFVALAAPAAAMVAVTADNRVGDVAAMAGLGVAGVEAALVDPADYATPPTATWTDQLSRLIRSTALPVVVPTQHALTPDHVNALAGIGVGGLLLGAVVTGTAPREVEAATRRFRERLDDLDPA